MARSKGAKAQQGTMGSLRRSTRNKSAPDLFKPVSSFSQKEDFNSSSAQAVNIAPDIKRGPGRPKQIVQAVAPVANTTRRGRPKRVAHAVNGPKARGRPKAIIQYPKAPQITKKRGRPSKKRNGSQQKDEPAKDGGFHIGNIEGTFAIECRTVSSGWVDGYSHKMSLSATQPSDSDRITAAFDVGLVEGTMRIAASQAEVEKWCLSDEEMSDVVHTGSSSNAQNNNTAIKTGQQQSSNEEANPATSAHRVHFKWRGHSPVDGVQYQNDKLQIGWLDFPSVDGGEFWGVIDFPDTLGAGIWLHGVRTTKKTKAAPMSWHASSTQARDDTEGTSGSPEAVIAEVDGQPTD